MAQAPVHDVAEHRSTRLVEACGQVIHFCPRHGGVLKPQRKHVKCQDAGVQV